MIPQLPKAVLFDMDGVLIDSMPMHVASWQRIYKRYNIDVSDERIYMDEGRVGLSTIENIFKDKKGQILSKEEQERIYAEKTTEIGNMPTPPPIDQIPNFVQTVINSGCSTSVVTGSAQKGLLNTLNRYFPNCFEESTMITANDVIQGKPHPEPYLKGLEKHGIKAEEAIVVENAPLGILSAKAAGIFVLAINTGKLSNEVLYDAGADVVVNSALELLEWWKASFKTVTS